jgi:outer membrane protein assembly factor BamB
MKTQSGVLPLFIFSCLALCVCETAIYAQPIPSDDAARKASGNWPSFRGSHASGVADGQNLPDAWNGETGENIRWKVRVPGLAHSSPVIWDDKLFVTTAVSSQTDATFRHGLYGDGTASEDRSTHHWNILCFDKNIGELLWQRTAYEGIPRDKRHIKATYANSTPATDGRYVITVFGSEGLFAYDLDGKFLWKKDLGRLDVGAYDAPTYEWGSASSPIIYRDLVIVQCDTQGESFLIACNIRTGETAWRVARDELPSWGTPTIFPSETRSELVTNGSNFIRGYDPTSGRELWRLGGSSKITAPTPILTGETHLRHSPGRDGGYHPRKRRQLKPVCGLEQNAARTLHADPGHL